MASFEGKFSRRLLDAEGCDVTDVSHLAGSRGKVVQRWLQMERAYEENV